MKMINYIENAEKKAGTQIKLANYLGLTSGYIRMVKAEKRCFSNDVCIKLADYIEEDRLEVIAANSLVTEKDEERRRIFESCFTKTSKAASFIIAALLISVLTIMTPQPANAQPVTNSIDTQFVLCKIRKIKELIINMLNKLFSGVVQAVFQRVNFAGY